MKKIRLVKTIILAFLMLLIGTAGIPDAYAVDVSVSLPTFDVTMNGIEINNEYRQYPFIVYKDITYFPMTYSDSRFLGIKTKWNDVTGLEVDCDSEADGTYDTYATEKKNVSRYTASIPAFKIRVNGKTIENSKEKYPLLQFRNVTYFPLTWRFAVDEFGWDYRFNAKSGLTIKNPKYEGPQIKEARLPLTVRDGGSFIGDFTVAGSFFYYEGDKGIIYQASIDNPSDRKSVYELPLWTYGSSYVYPKLDTIDEKVIMTYHQGGASMGSDFRIILKEDGTSEDYSYGYLSRKEFGEYTVNVSQSVPPSQNNLSVKKAGEQEFTQVGDHNYIYGWTWKKTEVSEGGGPSNDFFLIEDNLYILAYYKPREEFGTTGIHKVNIHTGETTRLCDQSAVKFIMCGDFIYFMDEEGFLYKMPVDGNSAEKLSDKAASDFTVLNHTVYYVSRYDDGLELFRLGLEGSLNPGGVVKSLTAQEGYVVCTFEDNSSSPYKMMVFGSNGKTLYRMSQAVTKVVVQKDRIFYYKK